MGARDDLSKRSYFQTTLTDSVGAKPKSRSFPNDGEIVANRLATSRNSRFSFSSVKRSAGGWCIYRESTLAVASSSTINLLFRTIARAKHTSCFWPTLKFEPSADIFVSRPSGRSSTTVLSSTCGDKNVWIIVPLDRRISRLACESTGEKNRIIRTDGQITVVRQAVLSS